MSEPALCEVSGLPVGPETWGKPTRCRCAPCFAAKRLAQPAPIPADWAQIAALGAGARSAGGRGT